MAKGIIRTKEDCYQIEIDGLHEFEWTDFGETAQVEVNGLLYIAQVDIDDAGDLVDNLGDQWIYVSLVGVAIEESDGDDEEESSNSEDDNEEVAAEAEE